MIRDKEKLNAYLESKVSNVFKILPLYEEGNKGLDLYVESECDELISVQEIVEIKSSAKYITVLATLNGLKNEVQLDNNQAKVKREVFKTISTLKDMIETLEGV